MSTRCAHCGLEVRESAAPNGADDHRSSGEPLVFCCTGCRTVYGLLHEWGFTEYYRLQAAQPGEPTRAHRTDREFEDFDDPNFFAKNVENTPGGRCKTSFYLEGVHCAACVWLVEQLPTVTEGLASVRLDLARARADVEWSPDQVQLSAVARALDRVGYTPHPYRARDLTKLREAEDRALLVKLGVAAACALNVMVLQGAIYAGESGGMEGRFTAFFRWLAFVVSMPVVFFSARPFYRAAWAGLVRRVPHIDLPISAAIIVAFAFGALSIFRGEGEIYFDSVTALVTLLLGARYVQSRAQRAALERAESIRGATFVEFARKLPADGGRTVEVPVESLQPGDQVEVKSGELIPADGVVVSGRSSIDNAVLTGEPTPIAIAPGGHVSAGATNLGAPITVEVNAVGADTRVGALLGLVEEALSQRTPLIDWADRRSRSFVVVVLALAILGGIGWGIVDPAHALEHVVALLVVSCPCALALATPVALAVSLSRAARRGIFLKNADVVERMDRVTTVLLDKTGTLTAGELTLTQWTGSEHAEEVALALESGSTHPIAAALARGLWRQKNDAKALQPVADLEEIPGRGVRGWLDGRHVLVGSAEHLASFGVTIGAVDRARAETWADHGLSPLYVAEDTDVIGMAALGDPLAPGARDTILRLRAAGLRPRIVSGDHPAVVRRVARALDIPDEDAEGGMTPEDKRTRVLALQSGSSPERVLMAGDGVNDAAALAAAEVGVAVHGGSGAAAAAAHVVFGGKGLGLLLELVEGTARTRKVIRRNLGFSLVYNLGASTLALLGLIGPLGAAVLMPASSLTVILSSVLTATFRAEPAPKSKRPTKRGPTLQPLDSGPGFEPKSGFEPKIGAAMPREAH